MPQFLLARIRANGIAPYVEVLSGIPLTTFQITTGRAKTQVEGQIHRPFKWRENGMQAAKSGREKSGRFAKGHAGGPGRPRRPVEQEYLATLNGAVTLDAWRQIVQRAVADAVEGDAKAREWVAKFVVGNEPASLVQLAADEKAGLTADVAIESLVFEQRRSLLIARLSRELMNMTGTSAQTAKANNASTAPADKAQDNSASNSSGATPALP